MTNLVYLSPLPWASFAQRPHKFVEWFRAQGGGDVLWIDPYPTRLPCLADIGRAVSRRTGAESARETATDASVFVVRPRALPVEPLPLSRYINRPLWADVLEAVESFQARDDTWLVIGKPSQLAAVVLRNGGFSHSAYDCMDHFASFYKGVSRLVMENRERELAAKAEYVMASSMALYDRWRHLGVNLSVVRNACDPAALPPAVSERPRSPAVFGYIGTIGSWFDWDAVIALAECNTAAIVRLIGPIFCTMPRSLPANIELQGPKGHSKAMAAVAEFSVGLIPFKRTQLTDSVDPIKYYEYRAMGLPVISTRFGEMRHRADDPGVFLADTANEQKVASRAALGYRDSSSSVQAFRARESWAHRFSNSPLGAMLAAERAHP